LRRRLGDDFEKSRIAKGGREARPAVISRSASSESIFLCAYVVEAQTPCRSASIMAYRRKLRLFQALI
jgi:hypothetical protein